MLHFHAEESDEDTLIGHLDMVSRHEIEMLEYKVNKDP